MLFNSLEFLIFFPTVAAIYFAAPYRFRWLVLLIASYYFYMSWNPAYLILILISTVTAFVTARQMEEKPHVKSKYLIISLVINLSILFLFKYFNFFSNSAQSAFYLLGVPYSLPILDVLLPVGISFYTFQALGYTIDVYRGQQKSEKNLGIFALFVSFFPQLVAGPIERSNNLLPQFYKNHKIEYQRIVDGLKVVMWGMFKKVVIADRLAVVVNTVYNDPTSYTGIPLLIATFFFAIQIYCDFSGYSDIAIGTAKILGFNLMENFRQPYFSKSIAEFWRRWHISLSTWFRDYLYIPLGGNRVKPRRLYFNLGLVFVISGLWHGANWTFLVWGALHGGYLIFSVYTASFRERMIDFSGLRRFPRILTGIQMLGTFALVCFAWIFFRANTMSEALYIIRHLFVGLNFSGSYGLDVGGAYELALMAFSIGALLLVDVGQARANGQPILSKQPLVIRWLVYYAILFAIILFGKFGVTDFIYFQF